MRKLLALMLVLLAGPVQAADCPAFYRFVDFGNQGRDGVLRRGGTIVRAFDAAGTPLLLPAATICAAVDDLAIDGRGHRIPVVAHIAVDLSVAGLALTSLRLAKPTDPRAEAEAAAKAHRESLTHPDTLQTRGARFLCASTLGAATSCQLLSPYTNDAPLVVTCDGTRCTMPALLRDDALVIRATWPQRGSDPQELGTNIDAQLAQIYAFWEGQI